MIQLKNKEKSPCTWRPPQPHSFLWITIPALPGWNTWLPGYCVLWTTAERKMSRIDSLCWRAPQGWMLLAAPYSVLVLRQNASTERIKFIAFIQSSPSLSPLIDSSNLLRVGVRQQLSRSSPELQHPIILHGKHPLSNTGPGVIRSMVSCPIIWGWGLAESRRQVMHALVTEQMFFLPPIE